MTASAACSCSSFADLGGPCRHLRLALIEDRDRQLDGGADRPDAILHLALGRDPEGTCRRQPVPAREVAREQDALDALASGGEIEPLLHRQRL